MHRLCRCLVLTSKAWRVVARLRPVRIASRQRTCARRFFVPMPCSIVSKSIGRRGNCPTALSPPCFLSTFVAPSAIDKVE